MRFSKGFGVGPNACFSYYAGKIFSTLSFSVGNHAVLGKESALRFLVEGDGKMFFDSGRMEGETPARTSTLDVTGVEVLTFITRPLVERRGESNDTAKDHGVWADPRLII